MGKLIFYFIYWEIVTGRKKIKIYVKILFIKYFFICKFYYLSISIHLSEIILICFKTISYCNTEWHSIFKIIFKVRLIFKTLFKFSKHVESKRHKQKRLECTRCVTYIEYVRESSKWASDGNQFPKGCYLCLWSLSPYISNLQGRLIHSLNVEYLVQFLLGL